MITAVIIITIAMAWLAYETNYMTIRLACGGYPIPYSDYDFLDDSHYWLDVNYNGMNTPDIAMAILDDNGLDMPEMDNESIDWYRKEELAGIKEYLQYEPANRLVHLVKRSGKLKGHLDTITARQFNELTGCRTHTVRTWESLDYVASEMGYQDTETLKAEIERCAAIRRKYNI